MSLATKIKIGWWRQFEASFQSEREYKPATRQPPKKQLTTTVIPVSKTDLFAVIVLKTNHKTLHHNGI
jgi:hypothetical protein